MKLHSAAIGFGALIVSVFASGCATKGARLTNQSHPGPAVGTAVGTGVGVVAGNVAGAVVGVGEGVAAGVAKPFDNETRVVRVWQEVKTSDGRIIKVPVDVVVDKNGQPVK